MRQRKSIILFCLLFSTIAFAQRDGEQLIFSANLDHLLESELCSMINKGGTFIKGEGWQATSVESQLFIELQKALPYEGTFIVRAKNFDPESQNERGKQQIINLYSCKCGDKSIFYTDGSWCNVRTGNKYLWLKNDSLAYFKFLAAPRGFDTRLEVRCFDAAHKWDLNHEYEFKISWNRQRILCYMDDVEYANLKFEGQTVPFKYIFLGTDNLIWGYGAQPGPVYSGLEIYGRKMTNLDDKEAPYTSRLIPAYPNPFNASTIIEYTLAEETQFSLCIYNLRGEIVKTLESGHKQMGRYQIVWDGKSDRNDPLPSGVYFVRLDSPAFQDIFKATLLR
ncbi:T9SS type A sorting domain-containing protein [candidate division KSB1 bacterium]|nr:T9SS type A sorting domain-containing protein [candidate division KSB1 bacterium]